MRAADDRRLFAQTYVERLWPVLRDLPLDDLARALEVLEQAFLQRRHVFLIGNGGSAATASHLATDLLKGVADGGGPAVRAIAFSENVPLLTAIANDTSYREVFARQLQALAEPGDVLLVISGSGNSENIIRAIEAARRLGLITVAFLGMRGGMAAAMVDVPVVVPSSTYGPIEDVHMVLAHIVAAYLRQRAVAGARDTNL